MSILLDQIREGVITDPVDLSFAAENAGCESDDGPAVREVLLPLLQHNKAIVREGAIYGLMNHLDDSVLKEFKRLATEDPNPSIREVVEDIVSEGL